MAQTPLKFQNVQIGNRLGIGRKIVVYKAECDSLPCVGKVLDSTAMDVPSGIKTQFEILSRCQHPNIVQYLGMTAHPETKQPVYLVELMDSNLTEFLAKSRGQGPLPYYMQVDICHSIAQALNYLHSNDIIHRNLASRNILLSGGKAKVDISTSYILREEADCPGRQNYMPPEAFGMQYTCKLDCFSFGVLAVEIITKESPEPGPPNQSEIDRRRNHIQQIDPHHPLLPIVKGCLKDKDTDRPSSQELCRHLAVLKSCTEYTQSFRKDSPRYSLKMANQELTQELHEMRQQLTQANQELQEKSQQLARANQELREESQQLAQANQEKEEKSQQLAQANQELQEKRQQLAQANQELQEKSQQLAQANQELREKHQSVQPQLTSTDVRAWTVPRTEVEIQDQISGGAWGAVVKGRF